MTLPATFHGLLPVDVDHDLALVPVTEAAAAQMFALVERNRAALGRWMPWVESTTSVDGYLGWVRAVIGQEESGSELNGLVRDGGHLVGTIGLRVDRGNLNGSLGYWLDERAWHRGIITRCARTLLGVAFTEFGLGRVELLAATDNVASRAVAVRLGMTHEGTHRQAERFRTHRLDLEVYSILATEWAARSVSGDR